MRYASDVVQLLVRLTVPAEVGPRVLDALRSVVRGTRRQGEAAEVSVAVDAEDGNTFWYREEWPSQGALEAHVRSEPFAWLVSTLELADAPPRVECRVVGEARGIEFLAGLRGVDR